MFTIINKKMNNFAFIIFLLISIHNCLFSQENDCTKADNISGKFNPFTDIGKNFSECFTGNNLIYQFSGLASTYLIINSGLDYKMHNYFVKNNWFESYSVPAVYIGYAFPVALGGGLLAYGSLAKSDRERNAASAVIQASLISLVYSSALKLITGRPNPEPNEYNDNNQSRTFRFGFNRGGIHYGWPSGHMMANTAAVTSLLYFYKDKTELNILGGLYLGYLFFSVISHDKNTMHWFSDAVTGTLMGYAIGSTVGKSFHERYNPNDKINYEIKLMNSITGISFTIFF